MLSLEKGEDQRGRLMGIMADGQEYGKRAALLLFPCIFSCTLWDSLFFVFCPQIFAIRFVVVVVVVVVAFHLFIFILYLSLSSGVGCGSLRSEQVFPSGFVCCEDSFCCEDKFLGSACY